MVGIAGQLNLQAVLFNEFLVAGWGVPADPQHLCSQTVQCGQGQGEVHRFPGAATGIVLGIKVEHQPFSFEVIKTYFLSIHARQTELRRSISNLDHNTPPRY